MTVILPCQIRLATAQNCAKRLVILARLIRSGIVPRLEYDTESDTGSVVLRWPGCSTTQFRQDSGQVKSILTTCREVLLSTRNGCQGKYRLNASDLLLQGDIEEPSTSIASSSATLAASSPALTSAARDPCVRKSDGCPESCASWAGGGRSNDADGPILGTGCGNIRIVF